ncbi:GTPase [Phormidium sp. CCY1219]|uniref:GTPase n=1 Tax=Phormidium sp. CCY1219 TaxID=2886104 RepID=UPI002D1EB1F8|nr:GTPase [Phormidium sp. CCY1219]MEB3827639.1 50S ribosome-binding GTPase [Phormidium sp. CCY1219]
MSDSSRTAKQSLDYRFLLLAHMVCGDGQLHKKEEQMLEELAAQIRVGKGTLAEMEKILTQDQGQMSVELVAHRVTRDLQYEAMQQMLAVACVDGSCSPSERQMAKQVAQIWNWPDGEMKKLLEQAEDIHLLNQSDIKEGEKDKLSFGARLLAGADSLISRSLVDKLGQIAPDNVGRKVEHLRREILLSGPEYERAMARCAAISQEDFPLAKKALQQTTGTLLDLADNLQGVVREIQNKTGSNCQGSTEQEAAQQLEQIQQELRAEILKQVHRLRASLEAKQRALNYFTIAFMGKPQVGKTTLQAIITGESWDAIGGRKQHSTPLNRVYEWKNIRIIETPSARPVANKSDEEIAKSVIEEADIICYTVTTGSIKESEFKFLRLLKEKDKPLIILLNVKYNLRDSRRLQSFLKNPDKPFSQEYNSSLSRDIERIRCYAKAHYGNNSFEIVPVMLRAA